MGVSTVIGITLGALVPVALIAALAYLFMKLRAGEHVTMPLAFLFRMYLFLMSVISLMVMVFGLSFLLNAGLATVFGKDFSYQAPTLYKAIVLQPPIKEGEPLPPTPVRPDLEEQRSNRDKELNRQFREGAINGIIMTVIGGVVWLTHGVARRRMDNRQEQKENTLNRGYVIILLLVFGIGSIIGLTSGLSNLAKFALAGDEFTYRSPPGSSLATAMVFVPFWIYYLVAVLRKVQREDR